MFKSASLAVLLSVYHFECQEFSCTQELGKKKFWEKLAETSINFLHPSRLPDSVIPWSKREIIKRSAVRKKLVNYQEQMDWIFSFFIFEHTTHAANDTS